MNHLIGILGSYKSAPAASAEGPPVTSGLRIWLDGADPLGTGVAPANGTSITSWKDKSGNAADATSSGTCVYESSSKSISLTAGSYTNTTISAGTFNSVIFIFAVYRGKASGTGTLHPLITRSKASNNLGNPDMYNNTRIYMTGVGSFSSVTSSYNLDNSSISTRLIFGYSMNQSVNNISEWSNGTANTITGTYTLPANVDSGNSFNGIYIGTRGDGATGPFTGNFSEILIYNTALTATQRQDTEGYLARKWGLQTWLPSSHPYYYDSGPVPVTSGLRLWLDGSDPLATGTAPANGTSITSWKDKSGNSADATSSGTCVYQSFSKSIALTSGRYSNTTISPGTFDSAIFIFAVYKGKGVPTNTVATPLIIRSRAGYNIGNPEMFNNARYYMTGLSTWAGVSSSYHLDNSTSTHNIFEFSMNQSANNISEWTNGTSNTITGTYTLPPNMDSINSFNGIYIGTRGDNFHGPFTGTFSEILIYNTPLTATQRQQIEGYLGWKWGLQTQLPSNHPYYSTPPFSGIPGPTNISMATFTETDTTVSVSWTDASGATSYTVRFYSNTSATSSGGTLVETITDLTTTSQSSSITLLNNMYYYATVVSVDTSGASSFEKASTNTIQTTPTAPTNVTMGSYTAGASTISVTWTSVPRVASYTVRFYSNATATTTGGTLFQTITGVSSGATSQSSSTALVAITYYYATVVAINSAFSSTEETSSATILTTPSAPTTATMSAYTGGAATISVTWSAVTGASSYTVRFYSNTTATTTGGTLFQTITGVSSGASSQSSSTTLVTNTYYYASVITVISEVSSPERFTSNTIQTLPPAPATVTMGTYTAGNTTISVSWSAVSGISSYTVRFYSNATNTRTGGTLYQTFTNVSSGATSQSSLSTPSLSGNTYYYATVAAINSAFSSAEQASSATILTTAGPSAPTNVSMVAYVTGSSKISVSWTNSVTSGVTHTVQFYYNTTNSTTGGTPLGSPIINATSPRLSSTTLILNATRFYYATVEAVKSGVASNSIKSTATISVLTNTIAGIPSSTTNGIHIPLGGTIDPSNGDLYFSNTYSNNLSKISAVDNSLSVYIALTAPTGSVIYDNFIYVCGGNYIRKINLTGTPTATNLNTTTISNTQYITSDEAGNFYVSNSTGIIYKVTSAGAVSTYSTATNTGSTTVLGLAYHPPTGHIYFTNAPTGANTGFLRRVTAANTAATTIDTGLSFPVGVKMSPDNTTVYYSNTNASYIKSYVISTQVKTNIIGTGTAGNAITQVNNVYDIVPYTTSGGQKILYALDQGSQLIRVFNL